MKNAMRSAMILFTGLLLCVQSPAQFKSQVENQPSSVQSLINSNGGGIGNFLGLLNPDNFAMHHSFSLNYLASGEGGLSVASYTNSMFYKIADPLNLRFDVTLMGSPFGSYAGYQQNDFNKIFISRAQLNYKPSENTSIRVEFDQLPFNRYSYYDRYSPSSFFLGEH